MAGNASKAARRLSKWRADVRRLLSPATCGDGLAEAVRTVLRKTANIYKTIKDGGFDEEQCGELSRELIAVLCQVSSNLYFRGRDLLLGASTAEFDYWDIQCALLSYVLDLALAHGEPAAVSKVLFTLSKSKHRVWDVLVQTEAIASAAAVDEGDRVLDVFRRMAAYCSRACANPQLYFKFVACAACLARRLRERGWETVKPTALSIEPAEFDFEQWFAAQPALVALLPLSAAPRSRLKVIAKLCKSASSHAELLKACKEVSKPGGCSGTNIRSAYDAEATAEDDYFTIVDEGLEARELANVPSEFEDRQLQAIMESTLRHIGSSPASPRATDNEPNSELISDAIASPLNTENFLDKLLGCASVGGGVAGASEGVQKPRKRLDDTDKEYSEEASRLDDKAGEEGDRGKDCTQRKTSEGESSMGATLDPLDGQSTHSPHEGKRQRRKNRAHQRKARQGQAAPSVTGTVEKCVVPSSFIVGREGVESLSLQPSSQKLMDAAYSVSAAETSDATDLQHDKQTPLKRLEGYSAGSSAQKESYDQGIAKSNSKVSLQVSREATQNLSLQIRPVIEEVKVASSQHANGHSAGKLSLQGSERQLKGQSDSRSEPAEEASTNCCSKACRATAGRGYWIIDSSEEESNSEQCLGKCSTHSASADADEMPLGLDVESGNEGPCSDSESAGIGTRPSSRVTKEVTVKQNSACTASQTLSSRAIGKLEVLSNSEQVESGTEAVPQQSCKARGSRRAQQHIIIDSSSEESRSEQNVDENDMHSSNSGEEATLSLGAEPSGKAQFSGSESESAASQAGPSTKVVEAVSLQYQNSHIASTVSPEGTPKSENSTRSDGDESAEEAISQRSSKACGARNSRRRMIIDSSEDDSCDEQNLQADVHLGEPQGAAVPRTVKEVRRSTILSSSEPESSGDEHVDEDIVQPDAAGHKIPSNVSDDDEIPCEQRSPSVSSLQCTCVFSSDSESGGGPCSPKLRRKPLVSESDADNVAVLSCDEVLPERNSTTCLSEATTVDASQEQCSALPFLRLQESQTSQGDRQGENDADTGVLSEMTKDPVENSVFRLPFVKRACTVSTRNETEAKSQDGRGGSVKHGASKSSSAGETLPEVESKAVAGAIWTRRMLRSRSSQYLQAELVADSDQEGVAKPDSRNRGTSSSDRATGSTSLNRSTPVFLGDPHTSEAINPCQKKASICDESSDALPPEMEHMELPEEDQDLEPLSDDACVGTHEATVHEKSVTQRSLKKKQTMAWEGTHGNRRMRTSPRKHSISGPSHSKGASHETSSDYDTDISHSSNGVPSKRARSQPAKARQFQEVQLSKLAALRKRACHDADGQSATCKGELESEAESPDKRSDQEITHSSTARSSPKGKQRKGDGNTSPTSHEKLMSSITEWKLGTSLENTQKSPSSPQKGSIAAELAIQTKCARKQLSANMGTLLSPEKRCVAVGVRAERPGEAPDTPVQASLSSKLGSVTDDSSEKEFIPKRLLLTSRKKRASSNRKSPSTPVKEDIPARVLTRSATKRLLTSGKASLSPERNRTAKSMRAEGAAKAPDTLDATSAWQRLRSFSEEILDSDAESRMSSVFDYTHLSTTDPSSATGNIEVTLAEKGLINEPKEVDGKPERHLARLRASGTCFYTEVQLMPFSAKNDTEAVALASSQQSVKVRSGWRSMTNETVAASAAAPKHPGTCNEGPVHPEHCFSGELSHLSVSLLYSPSTSATENSSSVTASFERGGVLSPVLRSKKNSFSPKAASSFNGPEARSGIKKSGQFSLTARRSSQPETDGLLKSSPAVGNRRAMTNKTPEQSTLSSASQTRLSSSSHGGNLRVSKKTNQVQKKSTRMSALRGSKNSRDTAALTSPSLQVVDATDAKESPEKAPAPRRSARLSMKRGSPGSRISSRLAAVTQEEGNASDGEGNKSSTLSPSVQTTASNKGSNVSHSQTSLQVVLDRLQDRSGTRRRSSDICPACQRFPPATQDSGTMTDESYLHEEADFF